MHFHSIWLSFEHGLIHWSGSDYGEPYGHFEPYDMLSGIASLGVLSSIIVAYRKFYCAKKHCWRMGHHAFTDPKDGVTRKLCWKHHPDVVTRQLDGHGINRIHNRRLQHRDKEGSKLA
jgi:hypothetical protein